MGAAGVILLLDVILVPTTLFLTIGYHAYLWHRLRHKPCLATIGLNSIKRRSWLQQLNQGDEKKGMLAVQSLRNTLMATILTAIVTITISLCLAALANNSFNGANHLLPSLRFHEPPQYSSTSSSSILLGGLHSGKIAALKCGSASFLLLASFLCSAMGLGCLIDANFLVNALGMDRELSSSPDPEYTRSIMERGFRLAVVGNRVLCITFPLLLWVMFGPIPSALSSLALLGALYEHDFPATSLSSKINNN
ncbi:uncharacterized protein LOC113774970 isoform X2 [Coffea eugenioides]|uniref:uncharacterized protein LOC113774970 isoform X2 n=1 Tax=Coffea eugenioides TaxID=49369 RepID=UPI000F60E426|nr:uncharacterized protein LOC113774970 isoform X2 [Coffea eugenioides]